MRQAYDYWQDQPGSNRSSRAPPQGEGGPAHVQLRGQLKNQTRAEAQRWLHTWQTNCTLKRSRAAPGASAERGAPLRSLTSGKIASVLGPWRPVGQKWLGLGSAGVRRTTLDTLGVESAALNRNERLEGPRLLQEGNIFMSPKVQVMLPCGSPHLAKRGKRTRTCPAKTVC